MAEQAADYDSPWKEALQEFFADFVQFLLPPAHADIDWGRGHVFLDKELQQVAGDAVVGPRRADLLVKVWRRAVVSLYRFVDWVLQLPEDLEAAYWQQVRQMEETESMRYVTSAERFGIKQGIEQGMEQGMERGVLRVLRHRFGSNAAAELEEQLQGRTADELERLMDLALEVDTPAAFVRALQED